MMWFANITLVNMFVLFFFSNSKMFQSSKLYIYIKSLKYKFSFFVERFCFVICMDATQNEL